MCLSYLIFFLLPSSSSSFFFSLTYLPTSYWRLFFALSLPISLLMYSHLPPSYLPSSSHQPWDHFNLSHSFSLLPSHLLSLHLSTAHGLSSLLISSYPIYLNKNTPTSHLETGRAPIHELNRPLGLDSSDGGIDILGYDITSVQQTARHVFAVARITFYHLRAQGENKYFAS